MCPLENQSSAKDLQQSLVQKSSEYKLAYIGTVYLKKKKKKKKKSCKIFKREESIQEKSEKEKKISFTSIHPSQAYIFKSFKIFD
jgi:hypothetical protein